MGTSKSRNLPILTELTIGQVLTAYVQEVTEEWAWLLVAPHLRGRLFVLDSSTNPKELAKFQDRFKVGTAVSCRVKSMDHEKGTLDLTLKSTVANTKKAEFEVPQIDNEQLMTGVASATGVEIEKGDILGGRVVRVNPGVGGLSVQIAPSLFGRVHVTHLSDFWQDDPATGFKEGQFVTCVVLEVGKSLSGRPQVDLTLRQSLGGSPGTILDGSDKITSRFAYHTQTLHEGLVYYDFPLVVCIQYQYLIYTCCASLELVVLRVTPSFFTKFSVHPWWYFGDSNEEHSILGH